jgi:hypothetical protein
MTERRELTPAEAKCVELCKIFEDACYSSRLTIQVTASKDAAEAIAKLEMKGYLRTLRANYNKNQDRYEIAFSKTEFRKYLDCMLSFAGLNLRLDGSLKTYDGLTISNEYLS